MTEWFIMVAVLSGGVIIVLVGVLIAAIRARKS